MKTFVGDCRNSFDKNGECLLHQLPWTTVSDFAVADELAVEITEAAFTNHAKINPTLAENLKGHELTYLQADDVLMIYDNTTDTHFFFV